MSSKGAAVSYVQEKRFRYGRIYFLSTTAVSLGWEGKKRNLAHVCRSSTANVTYTMALREIIHTMSGGKSGAPNVSSPLECVRMLENVLR